ncbi:sensor histidine kinase [Vallitalea okinawensis]|uniref:sensor histidine kinase n=1 Tax=Vallitalea okinawensis TaxID=2078660 RepID=UPI000CFD9BA6|nr:HAMP domain-containing sensor histidine kinase [Vallitalea okinawensis]
MGKFKSLRKKLLSIYLGIIVGTFLILSALLPSIIRGYFIENQTDVLMREGQSIAEYYKATRFNFQFEVLAGLVNKMLETEMWLVNVETGQIVTSDGATGVMKLDSPLSKEVLKGNVVQTTGDFQGYFDVEVLTVGMPLYGDDGHMDLLLFLHTEIATIENTVDDMQTIITFVLGISLLVAFILIFILSRDIIGSINQMNIAAKKMAGGNFAAKVEIHTDDEVGQLAESFNHMGEELRKLEAMRRSFIANISHDFRSPLTSIKGFVSAILDGTIPEDMQDHYLNVVLDETERLAKMTNDILHLTKMESNQVQLEYRDFDVHEVIRKVLIGLEQRINEKNIKIELIFIDERLMVHGDLEQIQRAVHNLLDNAVKFVGENDQIFIESSVINKKVHISIIDTGPGINEESLKHIFDRFHKGDYSRGVHKLGTGLGLAIVKEIIKKHGEEITVSSKEGEGTAFTFTLALANNSKLLTKRS